MLSPCQGFFAAAFVILAQQHGDSTANFMKLKVIVLHAESEPVADDQDASVIAEVEVRSISH
jgi:hypothetical protein